uniref:Ig-like domain-containing protein n=1 Tax=Gopherus evgoodei TaxID=1825980 RepID=A0A8C4WCI3_9SAUR
AEGLVWGTCLLCTDPSLPRPNISLSPTGVTAPGADVTIRCQGQHQDVRFFLHKAGDLNPQQHMDPAGAGAEFRIPTVGLQHGGSYSCSYWPRSEPFVSSLPSDPVQLVVADSPYSKPSISLSPGGEISPGTDVTISCQGPRQGVRFKLYRAGVARWHMEPAGSTAEFRIPNARREDGGSYTCSYESLREPPISSPHSDPLQLVVEGEGVSAIPGREPWSPGAQPSPALTARPHSCPKSREGTQVSWLPPPPALTARPHSCSKSRERTRSPGAQPPTLL